MIRKIWDRIAYTLVEFVFPTKCLVCGEFFSPPQREDMLWESIEDITYQRQMAPFLCPTCLPGISCMESPICSKCGIMFKSRGGEDRVCNNCSMSPGRFRMARAFGVYNDQAFKKAIHRYKYDERIQLSRAFEKLLFSVFVRHWNKNDIDLIMPVPLHIKRFRERGFNQAYHLIRHWPRIAEKLNMDFSAMRIERDVIFKTKLTKPQATLKGKDRKKNLLGAFSVKNAHKIRGKRILLADDVFTTGATADECTRELLKNGAKSVDIITLARKM